MLRIYKDGSVSGTPDELLAYSLSDAVQIEPDPVMDELLRSHPEPEFWGMPPEMKDEPK